MALGLPAEKDIGETRLELVDELIAAHGPMSSKQAVEELVAVACGLKEPLRDHLAWIRKLRKAFSPHVTPETIEKSVASTRNRARRSGSE